MKVEISSRAKKDLAKLERPREIVSSQNFWT